MQFFLQCQHSNWWRFNTANLKMSNLALMRSNYALNWVNRAKKIDFYIFLSPFDAFKLLFFTFCFHTIVANYLNYYINKWKIYVDKESKVIRLINTAWSRVPIWFVGQEVVCKPGSLSRSGPTLHFVEIYI